MAQLQKAQVNKLQIQKKEACTGTEIICDKKKNKYYCTDSATGERHCGFCEHL